MYKDGSYLMVTGLHRKFIQVTSTEIQYLLEQNHKLL